LLEDRIGVLRWISAALFDGFELSIELRNGFFNRTLPDSLLSP